MTIEFELTMNALIRIWEELPGLAGEKWDDLYQQLEILVAQLNKANTLNEQARLIYQIMSILRTIPEAYDRLKIEIKILEMQSGRTRGHEPVQSYGYMRPKLFPEIPVLLPLSSAIQAVRGLFFTDDKRYLQGTVSEHGKEVENLIVSKTYQLELWIGKGQKGALIVPDPVDLSNLPPEEEHLLDVFFLAANCKFQKKHIKLRLKEPKSTSCTFYFDTPSSKGEFRAYIIVSYQRKIILQTAELRGLVIDSQGSWTHDDKLTFQPVVLKDIKTILQSDEQASYDWIAFGCQEGLLLPTIGDFIDPKGYGEQLTALMNVLKEASGSQSNVSALRQLAYQGWKAYENLLGQDPGLSILAQSEGKDRLRLQFVEPPNAPFPIELLYVFPGPYEKNATICTGYQPGLDYKTCPECAQRNKKEFGKVICPAGFLGVRAVIERRILDFGRPDVGYDLKLDIEPENKALSPLERVVWGASEKLTTGRAFEALVNQRSFQADFAPDWDQYDTLIQSSKPTLILLMPHVLEETSEMQIFEISNVLEETVKKPSKRAGEALRDHTRVEDGPFPLVLLLGCATEKLKVPFISPVTAARAGGAAVTIATLAPIHESHASGIAEVILTVLRQIMDRRSGQGCSFGEFMTLVRCAALEQGYYDALGLIADGDADWYIAPQGEEYHV